MCLWSDQPSLQIFWVFVQNWFDAWKFMENVRNFKFGKIGFQSLFLKSYHHILMHFVHQFQCFEVFLKCVLFFFSKLCFSQNFVSLCLFWLIKSVFRSIEIVFKNLREPLSILINRNWFSINRKSWIRFFKNWVWLVQTHFSKVFQTFLSLSKSDKASYQFFVVFLRSFCKVFLSQGWYVLFILPFAFYFMFHA